MHVLQDFLTAIDEIEGRAASGRVLTRADLDELLRHPSLAEEEIHCISRGGGARTDSPTLSITKTPVSLAIKRGLPPSSCVKRYRNHGDLRKLRQMIDDRLRGDPAAYRVKNDGNYQVYVAESAIADRLVRWIHRICEVIRFCSVNYQNIKMDIIRDKLANIVSSKTKDTFVEGIRKTVDCDAAICDVSEGSSSEVAKFFNELCEEHRYNVAVDKRAREEDIHRLTRDCLTTGLPMLLTLPQSPPLADKPLLMILFPLVNNRTVFRQKPHVQFGRHPFTTQALCVVKEKRKTSNFDIELISLAIEEYLNYRYQELRLDTLLDLIQQSNSALREPSASSIRDIDERLDRSFKFSLTRIIETTSAHHVALWIATPNRKKLQLRSCQFYDPSSRSKIRDSISINFDQNPTPIVVRSYIDAVTPTEGRYYIPNIRTKRDGGDNKKRKSRADGYPFWYNKPQIMPWESGYLSIFCLPFFFNEIPVGAIEVASRMRDAFSTQDKGYIERVKQAMEGLVENTFRRNDMQWLTDRLHTFQNIHELKNFLQSGPDISQSDIRRITQYAISAPPLILDSSKHVCAQDLQMAVRKAIRAGLAGVSRQRKTVAQRVVRWRLPAEFELPWLQAESTAVIIVNFVDNILAKVREEADRVTVGLRDGSETAMAGLLTASARNYLTITCETKANFEEDTLDRIGIAPLGRGGPDRKSSNTGFGLFLIGVLARLNNGTFDIDRSATPDGFRVFRVIIPLKGEERYGQNTQGAGAGYGQGKS